MNITEVFQLFPTQADCINHLEQVRWNGTPVCPYCGSDRTTAQPIEARHHCNSCNTAFSVTVGTIFHHTHLPLQKWFLAISLMLNAKKGVAARQLARDLDVNKNTAWYLAMRIRKAMEETDQRALLKGIVEMDETYIGGKPRKGSNNPPAKRGRGTTKTPVVGMVERGGKVRAQVVKTGKLNAKSLSSIARANIDYSNTLLITDEFGGYVGIAKFMAHETVNHQKTYVDGYRHTNSIESFWSLLKRGLVGQYHQLSVRHLPQYINEFCYRQNYREHSDLFSLTINRGLGV